MAKMVLKNINKIYGSNIQAIFDFNLEIKDKEFIVIVGPSGCGKSTILRMVAGLETITSGELYMDNLLWNEVPVNDRNIAMVFQSYALFPHMSVYENMAYGLKNLHLSKKEIDERVHQAALILEIEQFLSRKPNELSGGQKQRVSLGRALTRQVKLFLMDEPLSSLDASLRVQMRNEIVKLHEKIGTTTLYVTHDQSEAMTMANRIVVMNNGYIQQVGTPKEVYENPANMFVGSFIGNPAMNYINVKYSRGKVFLDDTIWNVPNIFHEQMKAYEGKEVVLGIRPEDIHKEEFETSIKINYRVEISELMGFEYILYGKTKNQSLIVKIPSRNEIKSHTEMDLFIDMTKVHFFDSITTNRII